MANETTTTAVIDGKTIQRAPSVILLSDGSPTYSSSSASWWAPNNNDDSGPGNSPYPGNGIKAILTGSYMKAAVDRNYNVSGSSAKTTVYTIGMGITSLETDKKNLAYMTLDPGTYWDDETVENSMKTDIKSYWASYTSANNTGTLNIDVGDQVYDYNIDDYVCVSADYYLTHPNTGYDVNPANGYDYVDKYYDADDSLSITNVFSSIVSNIAITAPEVPTEIKGSDPMTDGYITYTDPIGEYMELKDVKAIIYAGRTFTSKTTSTVGNTTTYTFSGSVDSPVYGKQEINNIIITVTETDGNQTLVIKIPASVIPLRVNEVMLNTDGSVKTHTNNGALPARVVYSVGLRSEIVKEADDGTVYIDKSKLSAEYVAANKNSDGTINFYSNKYTVNSHLENDNTVGNTTAEFEPSHTNKFYYILEDLPIYKDADFTRRVTALEGLDDETVYYYKIEYYHGNAVETEAIERTGAQLKTTALKTDEDGYLCRTAGSARINRILKFEGTKTENITNTAADFYYPEFLYSESDPSAYAGRFNVHLGNNGRLSMPVGGDLKITKSVTAGSGITAPDKTFEFTLDLDGSEVNGGTYDYITVNAAGQTVSSGTVSASNCKVYLKAGQSATVFGLPPQTAYSVTETATDGFTSSSTGATGTITAGNTSVAAFTNSYSVTPVDWPTEGSLSGTKILEGREWAATDSFTFFLMPYNNAPLPVGYDADAGVTVSGIPASGGQSATFEFGTIRFTAPGVYRYTVSEKEPENDEYLPGMSYSEALYNVEVTVVDSGDGSLRVASSDVQRLYNDKADSLFTYGPDGSIVMNSGEEAQDSIVFTNTYLAESVTRVPIAIKNYVDNSGENPLVSGMFEFELKALGVVVDGVLDTTNISAVPMPAGSSNGKITTTNEGRNVTFPSVTFTQADIPNGESVTYRYQMREIVPDEPVVGMTYDENEYIIDVVVSVDSQSSVLSVSAIYPNDERVVTFENEYTPVSVKTDINGSKKLVGRDMKQGEVFTFALGCDTATAAAVSSGSVVIPSSTASVSGGTDGVAKTFSFKDIEFKKAGTYVFTVSETAGSSPSVSYDTSTVTVTVVVSDAEQDGELEISSVTYGNGKTAAEFTNTYTSSFSGTPISLGGTKNLTGKSLLAGEFYFAVKEYFNGTEVRERWVTHSASDGDGGGAIVFLDRVSYTEAGTYEYVITEQIPENKVKGTTYDESKYRYTVVVEDDLNGNLTVTSSTLEKQIGTSWGSANGIVFNNVYTPTPKTVTLPLITKVLSGNRGEGLKAGEFEFELKIAAASPADGITLPTTTVVSNGADGKIVFDDITFTKAGTYIVSVKEKVPSDENKAPGMIYSDQTINVIYSVTDDRNGNLTANRVNIVGGTNIINVYNADPAEVVVDITKTFTGRNENEWLSTDNFEFEVKAADTATVAAIANGDIDFTLDSGSSDTATYTILSKDDKATANITVNKVGTYKFVVSEVNGGIAGVQYDGSEKEIVIVATDDTANAKIKVKINGVDTTTATVNFENEYVPQATAPVSFVAKKTVSVSDGNSYTLSGGEFEFTITGSQGAPMPSATTASNDADGNISFGNVSFTERGTYTYTVREVEENLGGFTYDGTVYTVTVTVTDDYASGKLVAQTSVSDGSNTVSEIKFNNTYSPEAVSVTFFGSKELRGGHKTLAADEFEFSLRKVTEGAPLPEKLTAKNSADGSFIFESIVFTNVGVFEYEITETDLGKDGYTYDSTVYTVTVTVTDDGNGHLIAAVSGLGTEETPTVKFVNSYVPEAVSALLGIDGELFKNLEGRDLRAEEFVFAVLDGEDREVATAKNSADGSFKFSLNFTKAGTYDYTVVEKNNGVGGVRYDEKVYGVTVTVTDGDGHLRVDSVLYTLDGEGVDNIVFNNVYKAAPADIVISATKKLTGRNLVAGEFGFVLREVGGNTVLTATNAADGSIVFGNISLSEVGTYVYTLSEVVGNADRITYDNTEYTVEITVTDGGNGKLTATAVLKNADGVVSEIVFENTYSAPAVMPEGPASTADGINFGLLLALLFVSCGGILGIALFTQKKNERQ